MKRYEFLKIIARETNYLVKAAQKLGIDHPEQVVNDIVIGMLEKKTYRQFDTLKGSVRGYVYGAVKNRGLVILRRRKFEEGLFVTHQELEFAEEAKTGYKRNHLDPEFNRDVKHVEAAQEPPDQEVRTDVALAVESLTAREKAMVRLVYMGVESVESAAELLGIAITDAQEALRSAKEALRAKLADYAPGKPLESGG